MVCGWCEKPTLLVWSNWKEHCEDCLSVFSSPYETVCKECKNGPYRSWRWAASLYAISATGSHYNPVIKQILDR